METQFKTVNSSIRSIEGLLNNQEVAERIIRSRPVSKDLASPKKVNGGYILAGVGAVGSVLSGLMAQSAYDNLTNENAIPYLLTAVGASLLCAGAAVYGAVRGRQLNEKNNH